MHNTLIMLSIYDFRLSRYGGTGSGEIAGSDTGWFLYRVPVLIQGASSEVRKS
jgi:hypothetical protein